MSSYRSSSCESSLQYDIKFLQARPKVLVEPLEKKSRELIANTKMTQLACLACKKKLVYLIQVNALAPDKSYPTGKSPFR